MIARFTELVERRVALRGKQGAWLSLVGMTFLITLLAILAG